MFGAEAYWVKNRFEKDRSNCHIYIGARNENGRQAINDILSEANITGFYGQPRLDPSLILTLPPDDVIITTACIAFWKYDDIEDFLLQLKNRFGKNLFLEVQYHNTESQRLLNQRILSLHNEHKIPLIMGCDSHYIFEKQSQNRSDFLVSKNMIYPDEDGWYLDYPDGDTAYERFANQCILSNSEISDAMDNTNIFLEVDRYDNSIFDTNIKMVSLYPELSQEEKDHKYENLINGWWNGYKEKVPESKWSLYENEISKEVETVIQTNMADYFLVNHAIIKRGIENGGWITKSGRGSAVSFVTNKALGFTEVDRIAASVKMYPERFMSATRILQSGSLPDIDFNVAPVEPFAKAQQEVLGEDHALPMIAYGTMQTSAAWKLYAKSQGIDFTIANDVSNQIKKYEMVLKHADEDDKDSIAVHDYIEEQYHEIFDKSKNYQGVITSWSIAPCSYLLYQGNIRREIGLTKVKDHLCCLMDGHWAESGHFLKNDLLKVSVVDLIYRVFHRIGIEPFSVDELIAKCPPEDIAWEMYKKSCTVGLNQVEQIGTSSRVAAYSPRNISELCAFVAAIRPGFKSMYKTFASRKPFKYGVKAFDDLIQTPEMPNSFVLYQEMEMAALNYAGIPMSECYTAIKNIAKKRADKVLVYKDRFIEGFAKAIQCEGKSETASIELAEKLWKIIEDSSNYGFNASHAYCVAVDSLYCAWLKSHYPLQFYEVYLTIQQEKGNKDKMAAAKGEAEDYFKIVFPPFRFRQDNRSISLDIDKNAINNSLASIKGFGHEMGNVLYELKDFVSPYFIDLLLGMDTKGVKSSKVEPLIKIDYFLEYGNSRELLRINNVFNFLKQGTAKKIAKDKVRDTPLENIIQQFATDKNKNGTEAKSYTITDMSSLMIACERFIKEQHISDFDYKNKMQNQLDLLGYIDLTTNKEEDRRKLLVMDVRTLNSKDTGETWGYAVFARSIGSGKASRWTVKNCVYDKMPIKRMDIIQVDEDGWYKNKTGWLYLIKYTSIS